MRRICTLLTRASLINDHSRSVNVTVRLQLPLPDAIFRPLIHVILLCNFFLLFFVFRAIFKI